MSLGSHANVYNTCLRILRQRGFALRIEYEMTATGEDPDPLWIASKDGYEFLADNPIELLGLTAIYEHVQPKADVPYWWAIEGPDIWDELRQQADDKHA